MSDDYAIQANLSINGNLFNIRAGSVAELREIVEALATSADPIVSAMAQFKDAVVAKDAFTGSVKSGGGGKSQTKTNADGVPECKHGAMKDLRDKGYRADFYCAAPRGETQCKPVKL